MLAASGGTTLLLALGVAAAPAAAQSAYPRKPVTIVTGAPPGSPLDILARLIASVLDTSLGQHFIVENKPGAARNLAADYVARSRPDGYTVLFGIDSPFTVNPHLYKKMPFKPGDLKPVTILGSSGLMIGVNPKTGISTVAELAEAAKTRTLNFCSGGIGSPGHLVLAEFEQMTKTKLNHIPYSGNAPAVAAIVSGQVDGGILATAGMIPYLDNGKITALAVTSAQRSKLAPSVPTVAELGYGKLQQEVLFIATVPAATPDPVVQTLAHAFADAMTRPEVQKRIHLLDLQPNGATGADAARILNEDSERYGRIIRATGMKIE
ncbi:MAG: BUG/TctC family periplasmic protein [Burkholderiaceae bacterium]|jgi:tripartite-type tricarboxylate transporter receptor subunit TctC|nr:MAG: BUG/TctC family periplasmic protein [Burkholderiaceae bacterium]